MLVNTSARTRTAELSRRRDGLVVPSSEASASADPAPRRSRDVISSGPATLDTPALDNLSTPATEAVRYLIASLQHADETALLPTRLGFTSALAGEGVSYISERVGAVLAHDSQERVCVVDLNWRASSSKTAKERTSRRRRPAGDGIAPERPGIAEAMRREASLRDILMETGDPRLTFVAAGSATEAEGQVFARSERLPLIISALERHHDRLILGLPPLLVSSAAVPLARHASAVALVVRQGLTTEVQVRTAMERLGPIPFAGIVLNCATSAIPRPLLRRLSNW
jgi:Mrp family chromosome partitioning ATPase